MINLVIIHYNTPELTNALCMSINKYIKQEHTIYLFDNSDVNPFVFRYDNLTWMQSDVIYPR